REAPDLVAARTVRGDLTLLEKSGAARARGRDRTRRLVPPGARGGRGRSRRRGAYSRASVRRVDGAARVPHPPRREAPPRRRAATRRVRTARGTLAREDRARGRRLIEWPPC